MTSQTVTHTPPDADSLPTHLPRRLAETAAAFLKLGCICFGGPIAHLGFFREEFVHKRRWLDDPAYADLVALCQFLPGPASSQVVFALGMRRASLPGALVASLCFTLPSALLMLLFAYGLASLGNLAHAPWLHGLKLAAVPVVAQAVWGMGKNLCPDKTRLTLCLLAASLLLLTSSALAQVAVIAAGGLFGCWFYRHQITPPAEPPQHEHIRGHLPAAAALALFLLLLLLLPLAASSTHNNALRVFDSFYRSGSLVFGGGHVVLPLLRAEVVPPGWITDDQFLAGYGAAQALPGPLFTFSAYLGAAMNPSFRGPHAFLNGLWALLAIFLPAWLLIAGALPFWHTLRNKPWAQASLRGANAAVVGVLLAALYQPVITESVRTAPDLAAALLAFALLQLWKLPPWAVVPLLAAAAYLLPTP